MPDIHHRFGPSSLRAREICPGFENTQSESYAAAMGTRIHHALEVDDFSGLANEWEVLLATKCVDARGHIITRHNFTAKETHREIKLDMDLGRGFSTFGTADELLIDGKTAIFIDWKTGRMAVDDAEINAQAQAYTLGAFQRFPDVDTITFYFVLPARDEISYHTFYRRDCERIKDRLRSIIELATEILGLFDRMEEVPMDALTPTLKNCQYCANSFRCPQIVKTALDIVSKYSSDFELPDNVHGSEINDPEILAKLLPLVPIIEGWAAGIKKRSREMVLEDGYDIPGYELKERVGTKTITSAAAAWDAVKANMTLDDFLAQIQDIPFNSLAAVIYESAPRGKKTKAKNELEDALRDAGVIKDAPKSIFLTAVRQ